MGKKAALPLTLEGAGVYNKGQKRDNGTQAARFFLQTKAPVGAGKMKKRRASWNPEYTGPGFTGIFETAAAAWEHAPAFVATINGDRPPSKRLQEMNTPPKSVKNAPEILSEVLKRKRATQMATAVGARRDALQSELTKVSRAAAGVVHNACKPALVRIVPRHTC